MTEQKSITLKLLSEWLERQCQGFYGGCRIDDHSPQVREFVDALHYYIEKDFGYTSDRRKRVKKKLETSKRDAKTENTK